MPLNTGANFRRVFKLPEESNGRLRPGVADNGMGIDPEYHEQISRRSCGAVRRMDPGRVEGGEGCDLHLHPPTSRGPGREK
jgi:hypothetical protein